MDDTRTDERASTVALALATTLQRLPDAFVFAVTSDGLWAELPAAVAAAGNPVLKVRAATELVIAEQRERIVDAWERTLADGGATVEVVLAGPGETRATVHAFDTRELYDVAIIVVAVAPDAGWELPADVASAASAPPRLVRTTKDATATLVDTDDLVPLLLGWTRDDMVGKRSLEFIHPDDQDVAVNAWFDMLSARGATTRARMRHSTKAGGWQWLEISNRNLLGEDGSGTVECEMLDVSEEMESQAAVRASERLLRQLAAALPVGIVHVDAVGRVQYANDQWREILGTDDDDDALLRCLAAVTSTDLDVLGTVLGRRGPAASVDVEITLAGATDGTTRHCTLAVRPLVDDDSTITGAVACLADVTEAVTLREELAWRAIHDDLTGCLNRKGVMDLLATRVEEDPDVTVVFIDLDGFKRINDQYGHVTGDRVLEHVADLLREAARPGDVIGRLGGDEFLVICTSVPDRDDADRFARQLSTAVEIDGAEIVLRASVGVHKVTDGDVDLDDVVARADAAMYASKLSVRAGAIL
jgi:diguanylate cyclase (GGDEF)-like protein/PAS domain S-box-containing protein